VEQIELSDAPHLFTVEDYLEIEIEGRTELIEGIIYDASPRDDAHRYAVNTLSLASRRSPYLTY